MPSPEAGTYLVYLKVAESMCLEENKAEMRKRAMESERQWMGRSRFGKIWKAVQKILTFTLSEMGNHSRVLSRSTTDSDLCFKMITFGHYMENRLERQGQKQGGQ